MSYDDDYASKALPRPPLDHLEWMHTPYSPFFKDDYITYSYFLTGGSWLQPYEFTGWRDEQLSSRKTCFIHAYLNPNNLYRYSGPDAKKYLSKYFTNSFEKFPIGSGKHGIACNEEGNVITDGVMLRTGENEFVKRLLTQLLGIENREPVVRDVGNQPERRTEPHAESVRPCQCDVSKSVAVEVGNSEAAYDNAATPERLRR